MHDTRDFVQRAEMRQRTAEKLACVRSDDQASGRVDRWWLWSRPFRWDIRVRYGAWPRGFGCLVARLVARRHSAWLVWPLGSWFTSRSTQHLAPVNVLLVRFRTRTGCFFSGGSAHDPHCLLDR
jgi:hypothetical protein